LSDYLGQWVLIYFYPKDNTPGCTKEACTFKSEMQRFNELKVKVIGVSADSEESHRKFIAKYGLNFTLLSDQKKDMIRAYEAAGIGTKRISYLIDPQGLIFKSYAKVNPTEHAEEVLNDVKNIYASNSGK
jgi:peroxiredoxin Q/BCP